jgi:hypothetical protein
MIREVIAFRDRCECAADKTGILLWKDRFDADWLSLRFTTEATEMKKQTLVSGFSC